MRRDEINKMICLRLEPGDDRQRTRRSIGWAESAREPLFEGPRTYDGLFGFELTMVGRTKGVASERVEDKGLLRCLVFRRSDGAAL
jgi:hypothetical protein